MEPSRPWSSLARQPNLMGELKANDRLRLKNKMSGIPKEQYWRLSSGLHPHVYLCGHAHIHVQTHTHMNRYIYSIKIIENISIGCPGHFSLLPYLPHEHLF